MSVPAALVTEIAHAAGFDLVGFGPPSVGEDGERFLRWLDSGRAGEMRYLERNRDRIADPARHAPGSRAVIGVAYDYGSPDGRVQGGGRVARYAVGRDYHRFLGKALHRLRQDLEHAGAPRGTIKIGTDAAPILERSLAVRAGIGFLAKSAGVISPRLGPYLLLGEALVPFELPVDPPAPGSCGTCTRCLDACPTGAITAPHEVDARRCLSYTTIELRGIVPAELRAAQGEWLFGCDVCLEVCPFTSKSRAAHAAVRPEMSRHPVLERFDLIGILELDEDRYRDEWTGTAMRRATRTGLRRNAATVLGNLGDPAAVPALRRALADADPVVRAHAAWALGRVAPRDPALDAARRRERDPAVLQEIVAALAAR